MTIIASRDLRNHTSAVLRQVAEGTDVTITVHGEPVAVLTRPRHTKPLGLTKAEFFAHLDRPRVPDPTLASDLAWISDGTTDDLGPIE
ncbi:MAG TPA: type II toxin-antitoxin system prevent-host-death family antitoxin [Phycicoccus sp.]|nr:type II toxin-antitoxin system prevent-host-death family antitoxin [Phycicoccus sp.]